MDAMFNADHNLDGLGSGRRSLLHFDEHNGFNTTSESDEDFWAAYMRDLTSVHFDKSLPPSLESTQTQKSKVDTAVKRLKSVAGSGAGFEPPTDKLIHYFLKRA